MGTKFLVLSLVATCGFLMTAVTLCSAETANDDLPMVYDYFRNSSENVQGLTAEADGFKLNGKKLKILSGALHYFRVHPDLWRDRIKKLRAVGANTLEIYVPWNIHEPKKDEFDFGDGNNEWSRFADIRRFLQICQEEDLLVLFRPGPYICAEWDFGGFPSWLQRDPDMKVRENYQPYLDRVKIYFDKLLPLVKDLQFTRGGPIIGMQVENEYGYFYPRSEEYLEFVYQIFVDHGFEHEQLLFSADGPGAEYSGTLKDKLFLTGNFGWDVDWNFGKLTELQPNKPLMVMEFYPAWSDHWFENHHTRAPGDFVDSVDAVLGKWDGSINFYMFHGGTNFGFMAGANYKDDAPNYHSDETSYDFEAPLSEAGDYTAKYHLVKGLFEYYAEPKIRRTEMIPESVKTAYPTLSLQGYLSYDDVIDRVPASSKFQVEKPVTMENLEMNDGNGQSYGYIVYRKLADISNGANFEAGPVKDFGILLIDGKLQPTGFQDANYWINSANNYSLSVGASGRHVVDLFVENMGRINFGIAHDFFQQKGLYPDSTYKLNGQDITNIEIIALEFSSEWVQSLEGFRPVTNETTIEAPVLVQSKFEISGEPTDTFLDMSAWHKGIVFVNGFNLGRYWKVGPQQTLYVPAPVLKRGENIITVFEQLEPANQIIFTDKHNLGPV